MAITTSRQDEERMMCYNIFRIWRWIKDKWTQWNLRRETELNKW